MRKKLPRVPRMMGVPLNIDTGVNLVKAAKDIATLRFSPQHIREERQAICSDCPSWNEASNRCNECGCQMRVKVSLNSSKCPLNKWGAFIPK